MSRFPSTRLFPPCLTAKAQWRALLLLSLFLLPLLASSASAGQPIPVTGDEQGDKRTGQAEVWHDPDSSRSLTQVETALRNGEFTPLETAGSTGLKPGTFWSHFALTNRQDHPITLNIEYTDHQLIGLTVYRKNAGEAYRLQADLSMTRPFDERPVSHNRFVFPVTLEPGQTSDFLIRYNSDELGFVFPSMRIWNADNLRASHTIETSAMAFLFGGFFLMSIFAFVGGIATGEKVFYAYSVYSMSKITVWGTILGYTHQYLIRADFQWFFMSVSGAITILCGLTFARIFLQTRTHTPRLDYLLLLMMANAAVLLIGALFEIKPLALITITIALLLYPVMIVIGIVRWRQGSQEAGIFALAWSLLVCGLVVQALRDMGFVPHTFLNYYWPPFASFTEMLTIMAAMGLMVRRLRQQKQVAELRYRKHLEQSKAELEALVTARTKELEGAKRRAELEARTDALTGIRNRRSFLFDAALALKTANRQGRPLSLLMFDIDHFKTINDTHGHSMGDEALRRFTQTILGQIRETDIFGRLGGEEFGLMISEDPKNTLITAERLRQAIAQIGLPTGHDTVQFTASIGIAHQQAASTAESLLRQADQALYEAKKRGRNTVITYAEGGGAAVAN